MQIFQKTLKYILILIFSLHLLFSISFGSDHALPDLALQVVDKSHSEIITEIPHSWKIAVNSETPIKNESITIEVLEGTVKNPTLKSSGNVDFLSLKAIVDNVVSSQMTDEQRALALWRFVMDNTYHGPWGTSSDGLEHLNVYGYGYCGTFAIVLESLWWAAGLKARHVNIGNHAATEVYYDNDWHYMDAHRRCFFLEKDNRTIASLEDLNYDPELWDMKRKKKAAKKGEKKYYYMTMHPQGHGSSPEYSNDFTLSKGDIIMFTWKKKGKWCLERGAEGGGKPAPEPAIYANGIFRFLRNLSDPVQGRECLVSSKNIGWEDLAAGYLHPQKVQEDAYLVYKVLVPYFIPSTSISGKFMRKYSEDLIAIDISTNNGQNWVNLWEATETGIINAQLTTSQTQEVNIYKPWKYSYLLRIRMKAEKSIHDVKGYLFESVSDLFYNPKSLPNLKNGQNMITFNDEGSLPQSIKLTYKWKENLPIRISNEFPLEGEKVTLSAQITNNGKEEANGIVVAFYLGDPHQGGIEIGRANIKKILPGKREYAQVTWEATRKLQNKGNKTRGAEIYVIVDPDNVINESDESNNSFSRTIIVLNPPCVSIPSNSFVKFERKKDNPVILAITATVRNFSSSVNYGFYISDHAEAEKIIVKFFDGEPQKGKQIGTNQVIESLKPLEIKNVSVDWDISKLNRQHKIYVQVFTPENVIQALGPKKPEEISTAIDLDMYRECMADRD